MKEIKLAIILVIIVVLLYYLRAFERINLAFLNYIFYLRGPLRFSSDIVVVGIADRCLTRLGRWPIDRSYYLKFLEIIERSHPKAVGIDIILSEPSEMDSEIGDVSKKIGKVIYPAYFNVEDNNLYLPNPVIRKGAYSIGHINVIPAINSYIYSIPAEISYNAQKIRAFSIELSDAYMDRPLKLITHKGNLLINYSGCNIDLILFSDVIAGKVPLHIFKEKIVLVGVTAKGLGDEYPVPSYKEPISGLEIHANAVNTIITGSFLTKVSETNNILLILLLSSILIIFYNNPLRVISLGLILVTVSFIIGFILFLRGIIIDVPPVIISILLLIGTFPVPAYIKERDEKKKIRNIFEMYLAPEVIDDLLKHPEYWNLKGEEVNVTVMFVDISNFTGFSQKHKTCEVVEFLNRYFSLVTDIIFKHRGTLDKFIGDAVMAVYGAPIRYEDHPIKAIKSAFEIVEMAEKNNIKVKIGINTGNVIIGNIGTEKRIQYTVIGDAVNMAEYIESIAKPGEILIGEETYALVKDKVDAEEMLLSGKYEGRRCYRVKRLIG